MILWMDYSWLVIIIWYINHHGYQIQRWIEGTLKEDASLAGSLSTNVFQKLFLNTMFVVRTFCLEGSSFTKYGKRNRIKNMRWNIYYKIYILVNHRFFHDRNEINIELSVVRTTWINIMENLKHETLIISSNRMSLDQIADRKVFWKGFDTYYGQNIKLKSPRLQWTT